MTNSNGEFSSKANRWFGTTARNWIPLLVILIPLVGYFFTQNARIAALEKDMKETSQNIGELRAVDTRVSILEAKVDDIRSDIKDLKSYFGLPRESSQ